MGVMVHVMASVVVWACLSSSSSNRISSRSSSTEQREDEDEDEAVQEYLDGLGIVGMSELTF